MMESCAPTLAAYLFFAARVGYCKACLTATMEML